MNKTIKILLTALLLSLILVVSGCEGSSTGSIRLNLTDAPVDDPDIKAVNIYVTAIGYHVGDDSDDDGWIWVEFDEAKEYNLLELTGGESELLAEFSLPAGKVTQLRFMLMVPEAEGDPGCHLVLEGDDDTTDADDEVKELFVTSGDKSGFKATGEFDVPVNGEVKLTADFDARKSIIVRGNGAFNLKPTIRLIVEDEAGKIIGSVGYDGDNTPAVYAYEDGEYAESELTAASEEETAFPNAVSSFAIADIDGDEDLDFILAFLAAGTYDLVFVELDADGAYIADSVHFVEDVVVESKGNTSVEFDYTTAE